MVDDAGNVTLQETDSDAARVWLNICKSNNFNAFPVKYPPLTYQFIIGQLGFLTTRDVEQIVKKYFLISITQELDIVSLTDDNGKLTERNKRTIDILRQLFPTLTQVGEELPFFLNLHPLVQNDLLLLLLIACETPP